MKTLLFVFNPNAGKGLLKKNLCDIIDTFTKNGYIVTAYPTQAKGDGAERISQLAADYDVLVCSGGDGTLSETISALLGMDEADRPILGYIPSGSTNDFANSLDIPKKFIEAAQSATEGVPFQIDVGTLGENYFCYVAAFGAFVDVTYQTDQALKNRLGHAAYIIEGAKSLGRIKSHHLKVEINDEQSFEGDYILGMVTNSVSVGGIVRLDRLSKNEVVYDDGKFEVLLVKSPDNILETAELLSNFFNTNMLNISALNEKYFQTFKASHVKITSDEPVIWTIDGENGGSHTVADIVNHPRAIKITIGKSSPTPYSLISNSDENPESNSFEIGKKDV